MGLYDRWVLPRVLNVLMGMPEMTEERNKCLAGVHGSELGFGAGHNLPW